MVRNTKQFLKKNWSFFFVVLIILFMWLGFMFFFFLKAEEITKNPCSICAKTMGRDISCSVYGEGITTRIFLVNGSIIDIKPNQTIKIEF